MITDEMSRENELASEPRSGRHTTRKDRLVGKQSPNYPHADYPKCWKSLIRVLGSDRFYVIPNAGRNEAFCRHLRAHGKALMRDETAGVGKQPAHRRAAIAYTSIQINSSEAPKLGRGKGRMFRDRS